MKPPQAPEKTNPIKPNQTQSPKSQNEPKLNFNKLLQKKRWFRSPKKQTQFPKCQKMNANVYIIEDYENETVFRPQKNKPKQTQFKPEFTYPHFLLKYEDMPPK